MGVVTVNPATGERLAEYPRQEAAAVFAALDRAVAAGREWSARPVAERAALLPPLAARLRARAPELARLMSLEMGKPVTEARGEVEKCAWLCEVYAERSAEWLADTPMKADGLRHHVAYQPLGVVLSIMPWNYPFWQALRFGVPTLTAGNTSLLKHASNVTGCGLAISELFAEAGYPAGTFQTIVCDHATIAGLVAHDDVRGLSLTGSVEAGRRIAELAGRNLKKVVLELGGSDPFIVLEDADLEAAVRGAVTGRMLCTGQSCIAAKRFIVARAVVAEFTERFAAAMAALPIGDPLDEGTRVGAIVNEEEMKVLADQCADALAAGARLLTGGRRLERAGCFFPPTVLADVTPGMAVWRDEVFGPIAPVMAVANDEEAVRLANASVFGLGGCVWTRDLERGERLARRLEAGTVFVNSIVKSDPRMPFGGVKQSGLGRELSWHGLREFTNVQGVNVYPA
ncbi:MAG: NAD-dependent succinate-semialdehyde dehydrogenase [bacterium]|nr:NAD-dependent succinate-semialdehyde dehydrogenase [bacterium]